MIDDQSFTIQEYVKGFFHNKAINESVARSTGSKQRIGLRYQKRIPNFKHSPVHEERETFPD